ncbi:MAG TPA: hypothetical protein VFG76_08150 [Candidatus Polarisedimenticolia bacterium]|nr:hypothetical protein [Candidatus Polarisedimenticolia bacterium]
MTIQDQEVTTLDSPPISRILRQTQPWALLMGVLGFMAAVFMVVAGVGAGLLGVMDRKQEAAVLLIVYPLMGVLYFFPSMYLVRYANRIRAFVARGEQRQLEAALEAQRSFWRFVGILSLASLAFAMLAIVLAVVVSMNFAR